MPADMYMYTHMSVCICMVCVCVCVCVSVYAYNDNMGPTGTTSPPYMQGKGQLPWIPSNKICAVQHEGTAQLKSDLSDQLDEVYATVSA